MTVLTVGTVATILTGGAAAVPIAATAAAGASTAGGAVVVTGVTTAGAAAAAGAAAGTGIAGLGTAGCIATGPLGWVVLGVTKEEQLSDVYTFDCWKPVLHDVSREPSNGRLLKDVACDPRIKQVTATNIDADLPTFVLQNVWDEEFRIEYVYLADGQLTAHAVQI